MRLSLLYKILFNNFTGLKIEELDLRNEIQGFLDSPNLYDYVSKGFEENCKSEIFKLHKESMKLEISKYGRTIEYLIKDSENNVTEQKITYSERSDFSSDDTKQILDQILEFINQYQTKFIFSFDLPDIFLRKGFFKELLQNENFINIFEIFICEIKENYHLEQNFRVDKFNSGQNYYLPYFYKFSDGKIYCASLITTINFFHNYLRDVAVYFTAREKNFGNKNEIQEYLKKNYFLDTSEIIEIFKIYTKSVYENELVELMSKNFISGVLNNHYELYWNKLKKNKKFLDIREKFLNTLEDENALKFEVIFEYDCFCVKNFSSCKNKCAILYKDKFYFWDEGETKNFEDYPENLTSRRLFIIAIFNYVISNNFEIIKELVSNSQFSFFYVNYAACLLRQIGKLKIIARLIIMIYNFKVEDLSQEIYDSLLKNIHEELNRYDFLDLTHLKKMLDKNFDEKMIFRDSVKIISRS